MGTPIQLLYDDKQLVKYDVYLLRWTLKESNGLSLSKE